VPANTSSSRAAQLIADAVAKVPPAAFDKVHLDTDRRRASPDIGGRPLWSPCHPLADMKDRRYRRYPGRLQRFGIGAPAYETIYLVD